MKKIFKIKRQDDHEQSSYWEYFEVRTHPHMTVVGALKAIRRRPVNQEGKAVAPVVWECGCDKGQCGACVMMVNNKARLACETMIDNLSEPIVLEPLNKFKVMRDLMVDKAALYSTLTKIKSWQELTTLEPDDVPVKDKNPPKDYCVAASQCIFCGACLEACPHYHDLSAYLGALSLIQLIKHNHINPYHQNKNTRDTVLLSHQGSLACQNVQNCVFVCPKGIPVNDILGQAKRDSVKSFFKTVFG